VTSFLQVTKENVIGLTWLCYNISACCNLRHEPSLLTSSTIFLGMKGTRTILSSLKWEKQGSNIHTDI
jgi:hypothetical protein